MNKLRDYTVNWLPADFVIALLLLTFPLYYRLMPSLMIILGITLLFKRSSIKKVIQDLKPNQPHVWFIIFYVTHLIGYMYSENTEAAVTDLGIKFTFLIFPVLILWTETSIDLKKTVDLFLAGLFITVTILFSYAIFRSIYNVEDNNWAYFTESYLSFHMHRSYFATYAAIGSLLATHRYFKTKKVFYIGLSLILGVTTILTISKAGILILILTILPLIVYLSVRYYSWIRGVFIVTGVLAIIALSVMAVPRFKARFAMMFHGASLEILTTNNTSVESSAARVIMWNTSFDLIKNTPFIGVGTGDVEDELDRLNLERGNTGVVEQRLNAHNQYLNTAVQLGLLGLIPLLMVIGLSIWNSIKERSMPLFLVVTVIALTLMFESFLETQAGIIPVTLLICLFSLKSSPQRN